MTASKSSTPEVSGIASWVVLVLGAFEIPLSLPASDIDEFSSRIFPVLLFSWSSHIQSWFLYLVQSIKFNFQDVLVLAKKPSGWKIPHSSDVIFPRTNLFPKEKGYSHCKVSSTMEKCDLRLLPLTLSNHGRKVWATVLFMSATMHRGVKNVNFRFLLPWFTGHRYVEIREFCYHGNVM